MNTKHHDLGGKPTEAHDEFLDDDDTAFDFDDVVSGESMPNSSAPKQRLKNVCFCHNPNRPSCTKSWPNLAWAHASRWSA